MTTTANFHTSLLCIIHIDPTTTSVITFTQTSNNSTVGLTGRVKVVDNVATYAGPYYSCDGAVNSECCLPIFNDKAEVTGIIDAESFTVGSNMAVMGLTSFALEVLLTKRISYGDICSVSSLTACSGRLLHRGHHPRARACVRDCACDRQCVQCVKVESNEWEFLKGKMHRTPFTICSALRTGKLAFAIFTWQRFRVCVCVCVCVQSHTSTQSRAYERRT